MPIEKFDTERFPAEELDLLEYVTALSDVIAPDIAFDADGTAYETPSQAPFLFMFRYNRNALSVPVSYEEYMRHASDSSSLMDMIEAIGIDPEKFWYLLLFVSDYVVGSTIDTTKLSRTPAEEIEGLISFVDRHSDTAYTMSLKLSIPGSACTIDNPATIKAIASLCREGLAANPCRAGMDILKADRGYTTSESVMIWLFAKTFQRFFELYPQFTGLRGKKKEASKSTTLLISKLLYLTRFTKNTDYNISADNLKGIMKQYRTLNLNTFNSFYGG